MVSLSNHQPNDIRIWDLNIINTGDIGLYPTLFSLGPLKIHTYGALIALGISLALFYLSKQSKKYGFDYQKILDISIYLVLSGIIGARVFYVIIEYRNFEGDVTGIFKIWEGGLVFYGGFLTAFATGYYLVRKYKLPVWKTLDLFAPAVPLAHTFGRMGCFFAGCCYGKPTSLPWAITFKNPDSLAQPVLNIPIHPTQIYESLSNLIIFLFLHWLQKHKSFDSQISWTYVILYSIMRFLVEFLRGDERGFVFDGLLSTSQLITLIMIPFAVFMMLIMSKNKKKSKSFAKA